MASNAQRSDRRCAHLYPVQLVVAGSVRRARCLGCGAIGPAGDSLVSAMRALRVSVSGT